MGTKVGFSVLVTAIGILLSFLWGPGGTSFDARTASISCMLGGSSLYLWMLMVTLERQKLGPYKPRPILKVNVPKGENDETITNWFYTSQLEDTYQREWLTKWGLIYIFGYLLLLVLLRLPQLSGYSIQIYAAAIAFYSVGGVWKPGRFMARER